MDTTYKVGDRVRIGKSVCGSKPEGRLGTVVPWEWESPSNDHCINVEVDGNPQITKNPFPFRPHEIEHYKPEPKYKVGDKVVVTGKQYEGYSWWYGWEGTISYLAKHLSNDLPVYIVEFEGKDFTSGGFAEDEISRCKDVLPPVPEGYRLLKDREIPNPATDLRAYPGSEEYTSPSPDAGFYGKSAAEARRYHSAWKDISFCRPIDECPPIPEGFERVDDPEYVLQKGDKYSCRACRMDCNKSMYPDGWDTVRGSVGCTFGDFADDTYSESIYVCRPVTAATPEWEPTEEYLTLQKWVRGDEEQWRSE